MFEAGFLNGLTRISVELGSSRSRSDDDFVDRVNHSYTTTILMICTLIVLGRQFIGKPMSCWTPNEFTGAQGEYATLMCWVTSTYFIPPNQATIPSDLEFRRKNSIYYYQWVPFILMFQAAMFSLPCIIWRLFNWQSRIHLWTIMDLANKSGDVTEMAQSRANNLHFVVRHLEDALVMRHRRKRHKHYQSSSSTYQTSGSSTVPANEPVHNKTDTPWYAVLPLNISHRSRIPGPRPCSPQSSSYLVGLYLIVKALYIFNSTGQLFLIARSTFEVSRVSFIRGLLLERRVLNYTSVNISTPSSATPAPNSNKDFRFQRPLLGSGPPLEERLNTADKRATTFFTEHVLGQDGVFVLRLVSFNAGRLVASQIVEHVWTRYKQAMAPTTATKTGLVRGDRPQLSKLIIPPLPRRSMSHGPSKHILTQRTVTSATELSYSPSDPQSVISRSSSNATQVIQGVDGVRPRMGPPHIPRYHRTSEESRPFSSQSVSSSDRSCESGIRILQSPDITV
ncbi:unnamed protein product [Calicophoron daubneyi]|uniref:Innexin n=1 Tax=Calicophoron daubneyi TaxID=300641 RepID=A0AAV2TQI7_CALDB